MKKLQAIIEKEDEKHNLLEYVKFLTNKTNYETKNKDTWSLCLSKSKIIPFPEK